jgi:hypothetical protein
VVVENNDVFVEHCATRQSHVMAFDGFAHSGYYPINTFNYLHGINSYPESGHGYTIR